MGPVAEGILCVYEQEPCLDPLLPELVHHLLRDLRLRRIRQGFAVPEATSCLTPPVVATARICSLRTVRSTEAGPVRVEGTATWRDGL